MFQEGAIGESHSGGKLSTYKELCSLANEMGQPDLIYKFMDLANHQASLNSKRGAAFGFSKIAKQAGDALQPHLQLLIPRLVRYQYDPDKNVQVNIFELPGAEKLQVLFLRKFHANQLVVVIFSFFFCVCSLPRIVLLLHTIRNYEIEQHLPIISGNFILSISDCSLFVNIGCNGTHMEVASGRPQENY